MAGDALGALAVSVPAHGAAERSRSGSQPRKGAPPAPPGILVPLSSRLAGIALALPFPGVAAITHLLPKPAGRQERAPGGEPPALLPHSPSLPTEGGDRGC